MLPKKLISAVTSRKAKIGIVGLGSLSNAEKVSTRVLSLPMHPFMRWKVQKGIAGVLTQIRGY